MLDNYKVLTITHHNLNVDEIGNFVVHHEGKDDLRAKLSNLKEQTQLEELIYLSTCNRVSFICYSNEEFDLDYIKDFFKVVNPVLDVDKLKKISKFVDVYNGSKAVNHIYEVASSMDSLVVGEREIFRQFREAYQQSLEFGLVGDNLRMLENSTVKAAKEVYDKTKIGEKPLSIVSLAVKSLMDTGIAKDARLLIVGAGETNTLFAKFLKKYGFNNVSIFNRSLVQELFDADILKSEIEMQNHPMKNKITNAISTGQTANQIQVTINELQNIASKDKFLLFTDGILETLTPNELISIISHNNIADSMAIISNKVKQKSRDNSTLLLLEI